MNKVLEYFRTQVDSKFAQVPDDELTLFIGDSYPDYIQGDQDFGRRFKAVDRLWDIRKNRGDIGSTNNPVMRAAGNIAASGVEGFAGVPESIAIFADWLGGTVPLMDEGKELSELDTYKTGQWMREVANRFRPMTPENTGYWERFITETVPGGVGSTVAFMAGGIAGKALKVPQMLSVATMGAMVNGAESYERALQDGADSQQAFTSFLLNAGVGTSEAVPISKWIDKTVGKKYAGKLLKDMLVEGSEEALQEFGQQLSSNVIHQQVVNPDQPWMDGTGEGAGVGFTVGALFSLLTGAASRRAGRSLNMPELSSPQEKRGQSVQVKQPERGQEPEVQPASAASTAPADEPLINPVVIEFTNNQGQKFRTEFPENTPQPSIDSYLKSQGATGHTVIQGKPVSVEQDTPAPTPVKEEPDATEVKEEKEVPTEPAPQPVGDPGGNDFPMPAAALKKLDEVKPVEEKKPSTQVEAVETQVEEKPVEAPEPYQSLPPMKIPSAGVNSKDIAQKYGLPDDFYTNGQYLTDRYHSADNRVDDLHKQRIRGVTMEQAQAERREAWAEVVEGAKQKTSTITPAEPTATTKPKKKTARKKAAKKKEPASKSQVSASGIGETTDRQEDSDQIIPEPQDTIFFDRGGREYQADVEQVVNDADGNPTYQVDSFGPKFIKPVEVKRVKKSGRRKTREAAAAKAKEPKKKAKVYDSTKNTIPAPSKQRKASEVKKDWIAQLEEAIENAPAGFKPPGNPKADAYTDQVLHKGSPEQAQMITIEVPGGSTLKVYKTKENLENILKKVKKLATWSKTDNAFMPVKSGQQATKRIPRVKFSTGSPTASGKGLHPKKVERIISRITSKWNAPIEVMVTDLPGWEHNGHPVRGMVSGNQIVLNAAYLFNRTDVESVLLHEAVGHLGVEAVLGDKFTVEMNRIYQTLSNRQRNNLAVIAQRYGFDLDTDSGLSAALSELAAHAAEQSATTVQKGLWRRFLDAIQKFLNKAFGTKFGEAEVRGLLDQAREYLMSGGTGAGAAQPALSISDETQLDTEYMAAVESGDMETQQRLVDEAARMQPVSDQFDSSRVGTAFLGTEKKPEPTPSSSNVDTYSVPEDVLVEHLDKVESYQHMPNQFQRPGTPEERRRRFINFLKRNLKALHDAFPSEFRDRATHWYDGARRIAEEFSVHYGITPEQAGGIIAVLSPQKDWFKNVAQAEQVMGVWLQHQHTAILGEVFENEIEGIVMAARAADGKLKKEKSGETERQVSIRRNYNQRQHFEAQESRRKLLQQIKGKTLAQLADNPKLEAWAVRVIAQVSFGRYYHGVSPEGDRLNKVTNNDGSWSKNTWGSTDEIQKGLSIIRDGSMENITLKLGNKHKVRSFFNNIVAPNSPHGDVTIDTHAVAAALLMPLGSSSLPVKHNFAGGAPKFGVNGTYHLYQAAYQELARDLGIQPRQLQSITWEAVRLLFGSSDKSDANFVSKIRNVWKSSTNEKQARESILAPGISSPVWSGSGNNRRIKAKSKGIRRHGNPFDFGGSLRNGIRRAGPAGPRRSGIAFSLASTVQSVEAAAGEIGDTRLRQPEPRQRTDTRRHLDKIRRPSTVMMELSPSISRATQELELQEAYTRHALRKQTEALMKSLEATFQNGIQGWQLPSWMNAKHWKHRMKRMLNLAHPLAARLNAVSRNTDGSFKFESFTMRAGFLPQKSAEQNGLTIGDTIAVHNQLTGVSERLTVGEAIDHDGRHGYQLEREMSAAEQTELYDHFASEWGDSIWLVDTFIDPALTGVRQMVGGIEVPLFNRFDLEARMRANDPNFKGISGYTPDVIASRSLIGAIRTVTQSLRRGMRSPGRRYKTGEAREGKLLQDEYGAFMQTGGGSLQDLVHGFNIRAFQAQQEIDRRDWYQSVLRNASSIPTTGIPEGWTDFTQGITQVWDAIQAMRRSKLPLDDAGNPLFPETQDRLQSSDPNDPAFKAFFGEAAQLRGKRLMLPQQMVELLVQRAVAQQHHGRLYRMFGWMMRNSNQTLLAMPQTYINNVLTNEIFTAEEVTRFTLAGIGKMMLGKGQASARDFRVASNLVAGLVRHRFHGFMDQQYQETVDDILPDEVFEGSTRLRDLRVQDDVGAWDNLMRGELGSSLLQGIQYGNIDIRPKQRLAYAILKANADTYAKSHGQTVEEYLADPPKQDRLHAIGAAQLAYLNYKDSPEWLMKLRRKDWHPLLLQFPSFGYHYLAKQASRLNALRAFTKNLPAEERVEAVADLVSAAMFGLGIGGVIVSQAVKSLRPDDEEEEDIRETVGTSFVWKRDYNGNLEMKRVPRDLVLANRLNITAMLRWAGLGDPKREEDFWMRVRYFPQLSMAGATLLALDDGSKHGFGTGVESYGHQVKDLAGDFFSVGYGVKLAGKAMFGDDNPADAYSAGVPFEYYVTDKAMEALIPGTRQAGEVILSLDPERRRTTRSKQLDYNPGAWEVMKNEHWTGLINRLANGPVKDLPAAGPIELVTGNPAKVRTRDQYQKFTEAADTEAPNKREFVRERRNDNGTVSRYPQIAFVPERNRRIEDGKSLLSRNMGLNYRNVDRKALKDFLAKSRDEN